MEQPTEVYRFLFVNEEEGEEEEKVPKLSLHHPADEQTSVCPTLEQEILSLSPCVCGMKLLHLNP